jgi:cell division septation protein DedD
MKQPGSKDRSSVVYIGKGIIIAVVIATASVSFILGFFVGKSFRPPQPEQQAALPRENVIEQPNSVTAEPAADPVKEDVAQERVSDDPKKAPDREAEQRPQKLVETQKPAHVRETGETHKTPETHAPDKISKKRRFTVQIEALKSAAAADALKERLAKKGYKASVISNATKKHEKLFKVFVGEFATRKEAEVMVVKLKKTENLQHPFVTFRSE